MMLSALSEGRNNNLNLIRFCAAFAVLVSHAYPISLGPGAVEPLQVYLGQITLGSVSVYVFFVVSGFLITQSFDRSKTVGDWIAGRVLRLYPALIIVLTLTVLVLGPLVTTQPLKQYFSDPGTQSYIPQNASLAFLQYELPGVFQLNPYGGAINGSLWTLVHEVTCYVGVMIVGLMGVLLSRWRFSVGLALYLAGYLGLHVFEQQGHLPGKLSAFLNLSLPFVLGMVFYVWRNSLQLNWLIGIALIPFAILAKQTPAFFEGFVVVLAYWTFLLGYLPTGLIQTYNKIGDYSYGIYIYAFPMQQFVVFLFGPVTPVQNIYLAAPPTLLLAILSWHLVEKPALSKKKQIGATLSRAISRSC